MLGCPRQLKGSFVLVYLWDKDGDNGFSDQRQWFTWYRKPILGDIMPYWRKRVVLFRLTVVLTSAIHVTRSHCYLRKIVTMANVWSTWGGKIKQIIYIHNVCGLLAVDSLSWGPQCFLQDFCVWTFLSVQEYEALTRFNTLFMEYHSLWIGSTTISIVKQVNIWLS